LQQQHIGHADFIGFVELRQLVLHVTHGVVAEITGQAAAETREVFGDKYLVTRLVFGDEVERIAVSRFDHVVVADDFGAPGVGA
jgi:enhancing lycopene biosynthesis protein 2